MKDSERLLAIGAGAAVVLLVAFIGFRFYTGAVSRKLAVISDLETKLNRQRGLVKEALLASKKMSDYEARSLPPQPAIARSSYQHWLLTKVQDAGLHDQVVAPTSQRVDPNFVQQTFSVTGKGRYEQIVKLLDDIYRIDLLHRVSRISLKPIKDSKELELSLTIDAVSVRTAPESNELHNRPSQRLKLGSAEKYQLAIVGRNIFAPANQSPRISGLGRQKAETGRSVNIAAKVSDPDKFDRVKLELVKSATTDARLDASGKLLWTPKKAGEYEFEIAARDDNFPPRVITEKLVVTVTDPPPRPDPPPREEPKLAFDNAKHTVLSAILDVGGEGEVWLYVRPTATLLKLHEGDPFEIGSIKGTIREIGGNEFIFESSAKKTKGQRLLVARGEMLEQAALLPVETSTDAPVEAEEPDEPSEKPAPPATPASDDALPPPAGTGDNNAPKTE